MMTPTGTTVKPRPVLTYWERRARLPFGAVHQVAEALGVSVSAVSMCLHWEKYGASRRDRQIEAKLASLMTPRTAPTEAFGPRRMRDEK